MAASSLDIRTRHWVDRVGARSEEPAPDIEQAAAAEPPAAVVEAIDGSGKSATERVVIDVWRQVLGNSDVMIEDTFLDAGGSSLTAVQAISKLQQRLGVHVAVEEFIFQTGIQLAALCDQKMEARRLSESSEVAVGAGSFQMRGAGAGRCARCWRLRRGPPPRGMS